MTSRLNDRSFAKALEDEREHLETRCRTLLDALVGGPPVIQEAVRYMLLDSGKRLRPILCLWTHDALGGSNRDACLDVACALESLHTYSLVHDDLPCMDDDDLRRGKPSCHKKYGEAIAVLTGDALLTFCFDILASIRERWVVRESVIIETTRAIAKAAGTSGLIGGQVLDIMEEDIEHTKEMVETIHRQKTAALIAASMEVGAIVAGISNKDRETIHRAGVLAGRAFQIIDDVLDVQSDEKTLGKTPGKDVRDGKLTFPSIVGVDASKKEAFELIEKAKWELGAWGDLGPLVALLDFVVARSS
ncbi:MAG: polyprenyl synthetase family protein [Candidatus Latescibacterota bacterium]|nr:MAG: polyprenyl synthetase family protein [Candidatus Latescibacterota bacterium]